jgi:hypothetical protein
VLTLAIVRHAYSVLRADELVQASHCLAAGYRDRVRLGVPPGDPEQLEYLAAQRSDVCRLIDEQVAGIGVSAVSTAEFSPNAVQTPVAIGMEQAARKLTWECFYDAPLPGLQCNPTLVLSSGAMLRNWHGQCLDQLFTEVHPCGDTRKTLDEGITADTATSALLIRPGQSLQQATWSA